MSRNSINRLPLFVPYTSGTSEAGPSSSLVNVSIPLLIHGDFPCGSAGKESACNAGDLALMPGSGRFPWIEERLQELPGRNKFKCKKRGK